MTCHTPHHDGSNLYVSTPAPTLGERVDLKLRIPPTCGKPFQVFLRSVHDGEPRFTPCRAVGTGTAEDNDWQWWETSIEVTNAELKYRFLIQTPDTDEVLHWQWLNAAGVHHSDPPDHQDYRLVCHTPAPDWVAESVIYQIFPDRFSKSDKADQRPTPAWALPCTWDAPVEPTGLDTPRQFFGGDLDGITDHLDHIQELGATVLYLTPFFPGGSNHRYDASTFDHVDPALGGDESLIRLTTAAHARGLKVIGDLTLNHSGSGHQWFHEALRDPLSPEAGFYYFSPDHTEYACWLGVPSLPKFNWQSAELRERVITGSSSVLQRWLKPPFNLDGWRIDVGNMTGRHGADDMNHEIATLVNTTLRNVSVEAALLAESTNDTGQDFRGDTWHGAMTYSNFTRPLWQWLSNGSTSSNFFGAPMTSPPPATARQFKESNQTFTAPLPWRVRTQNMNALNTHDTARAASVLIPGGQEVGLGLMFSLPGIPTLFAGDEFGLEGINGEDARTPMPWNNTARAPKDLRQEIAELARLRHDIPALRTGSLRWIHAEEDVLAYVREDADATVLVIASRAATTNLHIDPLLLPQLDTTALTSCWHWGTLNVRQDGTGLSFSAPGPSVHWYRLPGIKAPRPTEEHNNAR